MDPVVISASLIMLIGLTLLLIIGAPVSIALGVPSVLAMIVIVGFDNGMLASAQRMFSGINSFPLLAIPFFVLAGVIMNNGGIATRLVNCAKVLSGRIPGSLAQTNVIANAMFGSISGSSVAAVAAVGQTLTPEMEKDGYKNEFSAAVNVAAAPSGMLIPPSNTLIVYSLVSGGTSIAALFMAGYIPGILWALACMVVAFIISKKHGYRSSERVSLKVAIKTILDAIPSLLLVVIVIGGIIGGVFTATEGAAIAVVYSLLLSFIYRAVKIKDLPRIFLESTRTTALVTLLIAVSSIMSWVMAFTNIPGLMGEAMLSLSDNPIIILLIMNIVLLFIGTFMDPTPGVLIFTPIFLPIVMEFGMDPVHFGIIIVMNMAIGNISPPVGSVLFVGAKIANVKVENIIMPLMPFFGALIVALLLVTYIPELSLWLPRLFGL
ncbi:TRAP transporter large permease [Bacillus sp. JJ1562]|uniref:TRAP transporter large permease n=1 Tax=Bacillus sp. JJ1562 TaxID=3122960 RepID=UPI003003905E